MKKLWVIGLLLPFISLAQPEDFGDWLAYNGNYQINKKWNLFNEFQLRNYNLLGNIEQILIRGAIGYNLTDNNNNIALGYAFIHSEPYISKNKTSSNNENRIFQQFITKQSYGRFNLLHRYRFEQRIFENNDVRLRLRYQLALNVALNKKQMGDHCLYLSINDEIFVNTLPNYFDRNRLFLGLGYRFSPKLRIDAGVLNQTSNALTRYQLNLTAFVNF